MSARSGNRSKLKTWEHPSKSGIWISHVQNRTAGATFNISFRVTIPAKLAGTRTRKQFATQQDAEEFAAAEETRLRKHGQEGMILTPVQRREVQSAFEKLTPAGIGLLDAVTFALKHMLPEGGDRTVQQVVDEMTMRKQTKLDAGKMRQCSFRDFKQRAARFAALFGSSQVKAVSLDEIKSWLSSLQLSGRSVRNYRLTVAQIMKHARKKNYRADNPMEAEDDWELEDSDRREPAILTVADAERLLNTAFAHPELDLGGAVALALFCGIRTEELKRLNWSAVRLGEAKPFVTVGREIAKKRRIRNVEIPACCVAWLRAWPQRDGMVTKNTYITDYVKRFAKLTKFARFGRNDEHGNWISAWDDNAMRHSFGSYMFALTGDSMRTAGLMGHKSNDQTLFDHYRALTTKENAEAFFALFPRTASGEVIRLSVA